MTNQIMSFITTLTHQDAFFLVQANSEMSYYFTKFVRKCVCVTQFLEYNKEYFGYSLNNLWQFRARAKPSGQNVRLNITAYISLNFLFILILSVLVKREGVNFLLLHNLLTNFYGIWHSFITFYQVCNKYLSPVRYSTYSATFILFGRISNRVTWLTVNFRLKIQVRKFDRTTHPPSHFRPTKF